LLTGMGHDGARELKTMQQAGALTIVQDRGSAVVYGMPGEALRLGAASHVLAPETAAATLNRLVQRRE
jgi:two-component system chemotaxis response regulator CheB